jgi:hypothetical protein
MVAADTAAATLVACPAAATLDANIQFRKLSRASAHLMLPSTGPFIRVFFPEILKKVLTSFRVSA